MYFDKHTASSVTNKVDATLWRLQPQLSRGRAMVAEAND